MRHISRAFARHPWLWTIASLFCLALAVIVYFTVPRITTPTEFLAAIFSPDGTQVLYVQRDLVVTVDPEQPFIGGIVEGPPSRNARLWRDRISIRKIRLADKHVEILRTLPATPWTGTKYRSGWDMWAELGWSPSADPEYMVGAKTFEPEWQFVMADARDNTGKRVVSEHWHDPSRITAHPHTSHSFLLAHGLEIQAARSHVVLFDQRSNPTVLVGPPIQELEPGPPRSKRAEIERLIALERERKAAVVSEAPPPNRAETLRWTYKQWRKRELLRTATLTAYRVGADAVGKAEVHAVSEQQYEQLLPWIRQAIATPGTPVNPRTANAHAGPNVDILSLTLLTSNEPVTILVRYDGRLYKLDYR